MVKLSVYEPPGCCSTGVCGPEVDDEMAQFAASLGWLEKQGVEIARFNLQSQPAAFVENSAVKSALDTDGMDCLPLIMVDDEVISRGAYLSRQALAESVELEAGEVDAAPAGGGCCGGSAAA